MRDSCRCGSGSGLGGSPGSVNVFHAAVFADGQPFASGLQLFFANLVFFTRFQAFGRGFVGGGHGAVALDVFLGFLVIVLRMGQRKSGAQGQRGHTTQDGRELEELLGETKAWHKSYLDWRSSNTLTR